MGGDKAVLAILQEFHDDIQDVALLDIPYQGEENENMVCSCSPSSKSYYKWTMSEGRNGQKGLRLYILLS
jgi:hypothetical protein